MIADQGYIIVFRFSAMGDVAMTIPVIRLLLDEYPNQKLVMVTRKSFRPMFKGIDRVEFFEANLQENHKGLLGLIRLYRALHARYPQAKIADLHQVLRTKILSVLFKLGGHSVAKIIKGRAQKKQITRKENKIIKSIPNSFDRYTSVFASLGFPFQLKSGLGLLKKETPVSFRLDELPFRVTIGVAPFAKHPEKMYPKEKMFELLNQLKSLPINVLLFGGGKTEEQILQSWTNESNNLFNLAGKYTLEEELHIISQLDLMVSMDSANMHLASLYGIPVISIWGPTHPATGFYGWGQDVNNMISLDLTCRPCSVYGNKTCWRGDHACMQGISPDMIYLKIREMLSMKLG